MAKNSPLKKTPFGFNLFRKIVLFTQKHINKIRLLNKYEQFLVKKATATNTKEVIPFFIIGAPRTGSTLLFQLLLNRYPFSYISNLASFFYTCPSTITVLSRHMLSKYQNRDLESKYGYISGFAAPSEAGPLMDYWFGNDLTTINVPEKHIDFVRNSISAISSVMGGPGLFKNMRLSLKIEPLAKMFPKAVFIHIRRDPVFVAQSIILTRRNLFQSDHEWWSYSLPQKKELLKLQPFEQVAYQIKTIWDTIQTAQANLTASKFIEISYDDLCQNTGNTLKLIEIVLLKNDIILRKRGPMNFNIRQSEKIQIPENEWKRLQAIISEVF